MAKHFLSIEARRDWDRILDFIATDSVDSALMVHGRFLEVFRFLAENPEAGHFREDLTSRPLRFFPVFSYLVVYIADTEPIEIVRILGGTRDVKNILR
jgi:plasmid stabilization system protein ParE